MDCKNFQNQFEVDAELEKESKQHLEGCKNCQTFRDEEVHLTRTIQSLPQVETPKDFGFRLNAYISSTEQVKRPLPAIWQIIRYALPTTAAVLIFGFVLINSNLFTNENPNLDQITEENKLELKEESEIETPLKDTNSSETLAVDTESSDQEIIPAGNSFEPVAPIISAERREPEFVTPVAKKEVKIRDAKNVINPAENLQNAEEEDFSGSRNIASTAPEVITPQSTNQNDSVRGESPKTNSVRKVDLINNLGMAVIEGSWKVTSIGKGSRADRAGIKVGDILISINGTSITDRNAQFARINSVRVLRKGKIISINLAN